jgi:hypothetical protein
MIQIKREVNKEIEMMTMIQLVFEKKRIKKIQIQIQLYIIGDDITRVITFFFVIH